MQVPSFNKSNSFTYAGVKLQIGFLLSSTGDGMMMLVTTTRARTMKMLLLFLRLRLLRHLRPTGTTRKKNESYRFQCAPQLRTGGFVSPWCECRLEEAEVERSQQQQQQQWQRE
jgi:hypothetical protein